MSQPAAHPLSQEVLHWNDVMTLRYQQFLESVTALDLEASTRHLGVFSRLLRHSLTFNQKHLIGLISDDSEQLNLLRADHMILGRTLDLVSEATGELEQIHNEDKSASRSALVERLDILVRINNILKRHHQRQQTLLIPILENSIDEDRGEKLAEELSTLMQPLKVH